MSSAERQPVIPNENHFESERQLWSLQVLTVAFINIFEAFEGGAEVRL